MTIHLSKGYLKPASKSRKQSEGEGHRQFVKLGIEQDIENPLVLGKGNGTVGEDDFIQRIKEKFLNNDASSREQPALRELRKEFKPEELIDHFTHLTGKDKEDICRRGRKRLRIRMEREIELKKRLDKLGSQLLQMSRGKI